MNPDLYDELFEDMLAGYDEGKWYARIDPGRGMVWVAAHHGGWDDALPRNLLLIADVLQRYIREGGLASWEYRDDVVGILWHDEGEWVPLTNIGVNQQMGFFSLDNFPNQKNEAVLY